MNAGGERARGGEGHPGPGQGPGHGVPGGGQGAAQVVSGGAGAQRHAELVHPRHRQLVAGHGEGEGAGDPGKLRSSWIVRVPGRLLGD